MKFPLFKVLVFVCVEFFCWAATGMFGLKKFDFITVVIFFFYKLS